ncbi:MAG: hypothetical protein KBC29_02700 [Candidatus Pacebacteria bacterium]|nr:hypothetical protein [Candidatus Paceibacterota bacterium]
MDKDFQTSFIPKKSLAEERVTTRRPASLLVFFATLVFFASLASAAGVYFYRASLVKQVEAMSSQLDKARARFEPSLITDLEDLDRRLSASESVISNHTVISPIFETLETLTLKTIRYTSMDYEIDKENGGAVNIKLRGQSSSGYTPIALQSDMFLQNKYIIDPIFSNLLVDASGKVNFDLEFTVDPTYLSYTEFVNRSAVSDASDIVPVSTQTTDTSVIEDTTNSTQLNP